MKFVAIFASGQISCSSIERRKYCFHGLQPDKSSDTPTCREKLISYYFLRFKHRQDAIVTRRATGENAFISSPRSPEESRRNPFDLADTSPPACFLCYRVLSFFPLCFTPRAAPRRAGGNTAVGFTRHEIGRPNKANCRTFLAG